MTWARICAQSEPLTDCQKLGWCFNRLVPCQHFGWWKVTTGDHRKYINDSWNVNESPGGLYVQRRCGVLHDGASFATWGEAGILQAPTWLNNVEQSISSLAWAMETADCPKLHDLRPKSDQPWSKSWRSARQSEFFLMKILIPWFKKDSQRPSADCCRPNRVVGDAWEPRVFSVNPGS